MCIHSQTREFMNSRRGPSTNNGKYLIAKEQMMEADPEILKNKIDE